MVPNIFINSSKYLFVSVKASLCSVIVVVQSVSHVLLFAIPWTAACQAPLCLTISQNLLKLMSIESVMPSNHLSSIIRFSSCLQSFLASRSFPMSRLFTSGCQSIGSSALASVFPTNSQGLFPLGFTGLISLCSKETPRVFSNNTVEMHEFFDPQPPLWSNSHIHT